MKIEHDTIQDQCAMQVNGTRYDLPAACQEIDRLQGQLKMLQSVSEAYKAAERSADDVYHIALQDLSTQLQATASDRAACQTAIIKLQECALTWLTLVARTAVVHLAKPCCCIRLLQCCWWHPVCPNQAICRLTVNQSELFLCHRRETVSSCCPVSFSTCPSTGFDMCRQLKQVEHEHADKCKELTEQAEAAEAERHFVELELNSARAERNLAAEQLAAKDAPVSSHAAEDVGKPSIEDLEAKLAASEQEVRPAIWLAVLTLESALPRQSAVR